MNSWDLREIEVLAFQIWERQGCPEGRSVEHWQEAEELVRAQWLTATEDRRGHQVRDLRARKVAA